MYEKSISYNKIPEHMYVRNVLQIKWQIKFHILIFFSSINFVAIFWWEKKTAHINVIQYKLVSFLEDKKLIKEKSNITGNVQHFGISPSWWFYHREPINAASSIMLILTLCLLKKKTTIIFFFIFNLSFVSNNKF